ncbi:MAG TPA: NADH:flavin oxidoreductase [Gaiellaceae bacterium]|nr:NADH:flavin oxidoreductase [Gaiellaceae bacterium]
MSEAADPIFEPLRFRNLTVKNRIFRSNVSGRFDLYDGTGTETRINWELKFARGGVGAIISSWTGVHPRGRIVPNYATIERDDQIPFWRELGERVHEHDCRFIVQLAHAGRQRDIPGFEHDLEPGLSSTDRSDALHGFRCRKATKAEIRELQEAFAQGARRAREAGLDGVEIHGANGYVFTQFLSSAINEREDEYGGSLENRARLLVETVEAIRREVGDDFHLQVKISATELGNALMPWAKKGNTIEDSVQVAKWLEAAGADAIHVSRGNTFPHPDNPAGTFSAKDVVATYDTMLSSGSKTFRNYVLFRTWPVYKVFEWRASRTTEQLEAASLDDARRIKESVSIPVVVTGGFQRASLIRDAIERGSCDAVAIGRGLIANNDLVRMFADGRDEAPRPCTYCNKCLYAVLESPLGCYDERRYDSREEMVAEIMSVFAKDPARVAA